MLRLLSNVLIRSNSFKFRSNYVLITLPNGIYRVVKFIDGALFGKQCLPFLVKKGLFLFHTIYRNVEERIKSCSNKNGEDIIQKKTESIR